MLIRGVPDDADVQRAVPLRPAVELSKMYVLPDVHGAGVSAALMVAALDAPRALDAACVWLGVNQENQRAQRFYAKHGFTVSGTKTFRLGGQHRKRLRDGAPGRSRADSARGGQRQQPRGGPQVLLAEPTRRASPR